MAGESEDVKKNKSASRNLLQAAVFPRIRLLWDGVGQLLRASIVSKSFSV